MMETLACLFAATVHDLDHLGLSNQFLVATADPRAVRYNDAHVNEAHHVATAFKLLMRPGNNFLSGLSPGEFVRFRELVLRLVVGTDMSDDKAILARLVAATKSQAAATEMAATETATETAATATTETAATETAATGLLPGGLVPASKEEAVVALTMTLKAADIGHLALPWELHVAWVKRLELEFFHQGDLEKALGLPVTFLMDRAKPGLSETQAGFFQFVVDPLFAALEVAFPGAKPMGEGVAANKAMWTTADDAANKAEMKAAKAEAEAETGAEEHEAAAQAAAEAGAGAALAAAAAAGSGMSAARLPKGGEAAAGL
jgi:hypothetical protein